MYNITEEEKELISSLSKEDEEFLLRLLRYKKLFEEKHEDKISLEDFLKLIIIAEVEEDD